MTREANLAGKVLTGLRRNPKVADIENGALDDGRFFVHLGEAWSFTRDPHNVTRSQSFRRAADAVAAVRDAVPAAEWPPARG